MTQKDNTTLLGNEAEIELQGDPETNSEPTLNSVQEGHTVPPIAQKVSRFGPQSGSRFGKGATHFNPPNKQRPGRAAGRGR